MPSYLPYDKHLTRALLRILEKYGPIHLDKLGIPLELAGVNSSKDGVRKALRRLQRNYRVVLDEAGYARLPIMGVDLLCQCPKEIDIFS